MTAGDRVELAVLTVGGLVLGVVTVFYLNVLVGTMPLPVSALAAAVGNVVLLQLAAQITGSPWRYAPLIAWVLVALVALLPGVNGNGALIYDWRALLLLFCGVGVPALAQSMNRLNHL
ncbi:MULTISPECIES: hypothetical protein [Gordonia]|uniref:hypothetical protein n=1 Tax=Gordonia TaxID=2053 RepID=UPI0030C78892